MNSGSFEAAEALVVPVFWGVLMPDIVEGCLGALVLSSALGRDDQRWWLRLTGGPTMEACDCSYSYSPPTGYDDTIFDCQCRWFRARSWFVMECSFRRIENAC